MFILQILIACTPDMTAVPDDTTDVLTAEADEDTTEILPIAGAEATLTLTVPPDLAGFYEIRPYRDDEEGALWIGEALELGAVLSETVTVALPAIAPWRDFTSDVDRPVSYAIGLRAEDADAEPGIYVGLAKTQLMFFGGELPDGASHGWNLTDYDEATSTPTWVSLEGGVTIEENLFGTVGLSISGGVDVEHGSTSHLQLSADALMNSMTAYDQPLADHGHWIIDIPGPPSILTEVSPVSGSILGLYAYDDADADNMRTLEEVRASACAGSHEAYVTWYSYAYDLGAAFRLFELNVKSGWDVISDAGAGDRSLPEADRSSMMLKQTCE